MAAGDAISDMYKLVQNETGEISAEKLHEELKQLHISLSVRQIEKLIQESSHQASKGMNGFREFMDEIFLFHEAYQSFKIYDVNGDNTISGDELIPACRNLSKIKNVDSFVKRFDVNKDGVLDIDEFAKAYVTLAREQLKK